MEPHPEQSSANYPEASESSPLLARSSSPPKPVPRAIVIAHWTAAIGGLLVTLLAFGVFLVDVLGPHPSLYYLPYPISRNLGNIALAGFLSAIFSTTSLLRTRRIGTLMPPFVAAVGHAGLALWLVMISIIGISVLVGGSRQMCHVYNRPEIPETVQECLKWAAKLSRFLWVYLGAVFVLGLEHTVLFVYTCSGPFRNGPWRESAASWKFPAGELRVQFSVNFERQETPAPAPRNATPVAEEAEV
ncbi:hypothetical protein B0T14DRAFT_246783 [Immersiella caudata]|uniref:Uncharacterized protein n=1 Tax=Immersiella caudata TaxID=314043 RepID=A0AA39WJC7_9PEZI|nr:hypothetical protein B0T14DRAFT_246783 [Immersiella caudata]